MAEIVPDFTELQDSIDPGEYRVRIVGSEIKTAKNSGAKYIKWELETVNEVDAKNNGRRVFTNTMMSGLGAFRLQDLYMAATGEKCEGAFDDAQLYGSEIAVVLVEGKDQDGNPTKWPDVKTMARVQ